MDNLLHLMDLNMTQGLTIIIVALIVGFSKTGIGGVTMLAIPILASVFGGKDSTGIMLPMLLVGDLFAVWYYRKSVEWKKVFQPLPWALVGIILGVVVGSYISDRTFLTLIGIIILICLGILVYSELKGKNIKLPVEAWFYVLVGILSGFASMIGNAAGPIFGIYLLALGFKKNNFMGTNAWFFFIINLTKLPLQIFVWHNIGIRTMTMTIVVLPLIALGAILGYYILKKINEKIFRYIVIIMTAIAAIKLFV
ncbi:MAG: sulfite exporter TauE/SafE family protein [Clostridiales bacterium]|nr:sulfite exporter TauE/SafE family protein [Clostridiales bacterium]